jgi:hypothetical protein
MHTHSSERPEEFPCQFCRRAFDLREDWLSHVRASHRSLNEALVLIANAEWAEPEAEGEDADA